jgi:penicillin-binding protein 2
MGYSTGRKPWSSDPPLSEFGEESFAVKQKLFLLGLLVFTVFAILSLQLGRMQLVNGAKYQVEAEDNRLRQVATKPSRGLIYDRKGTPLVENKASYAAAVVPADVPKDQETAITLSLQELIDVPAGEMQDKIEERRKSNDPFSPLILKEKLSDKTAFMLRERISQLPGARVIVEAQREYKQGPLLSDILGFVGRIDENEYADLKESGYMGDDLIGKMGVELTYENVLRGVPGVKSVETDAAGRDVRTLAEAPAQAGNSLILSIDADLQTKVNDILQAAMGKSKDAAAVVIDVKTGEILALVSLPAYDNNVFTTRPDEAAISSILGDPAKPLVNHALAERYPPGSTFKQITAVAALQEGIANADTTIFSPGVIYVQNEYDPKIRYAFKDWSALGSLNFYRGVAMSSDVYFYYLSGGFVENGREVFHGLGANKLADWMRRFGLGSKSGIDLPGESAGLVPDPDWKEKTIGEPWTIGDTYNMGIGQGYVTATPIQMALVTAAVANGGDILVPHVVHEIVDGNGAVILPPYRQVKNNLNVDPRNMGILREGMREAVAIPGGTASQSATKFAQIAGKTGTAEFGERHPDGTYDEHGWFTGFGPFQDPDIAVAVFLERGNGAINAAPVAGKIFDYYFSRQALANAGPP